MKSKVLAGQGKVILFLLKGDYMLVPSSIIQNLPKPKLPLIRLGVVHTSSDFKFCPLSDSCIHRCLPAAAVTRTSIGDVDT